MELFFFLYWEHFTSHIMSEAQLTKLCTQSEASPKSNDKLLTMHFWPSSVNKVDLNIVQYKVLFLILFFFSVLLVGHGHCLFSCLWADHDKLFCFYVVSYPIMSVRTKADMACGDLRWNIYAVLSYYFFDSCYYPAWKRRYKI